MSPVALGVPDHARTAWERLHAALDATTAPIPCQGTLRADWDAIRGPRADRAARHCLDCPVMQDCGQYAVIAGEPDGVWGGMTATERKHKK